MRNGKEGVQPRFMRVHGIDATLLKKLDCHITLMVHARTALVSISIKEWSPLLIEECRKPGLLQTETDFVSKEESYCDSYECSNQNCSFIKYYGRSNKLKKNDLTKAISAVMYVEELRNSNHALASKCGNLMM